MASQSVPQKTVRNMSTKENQESLPMNLCHLYVADSPAVQRLDFTMLSEAAAVSFPQREMTKTIYKLGQIVCVKPDSSDSHNLFIIACLQELVSPGMKRAKAKVFIQDAFNQVLFTEDTEMCQCQQLGTFVP